jgi:hypothetical protein
MPAVSFHVGNILLSAFPKRLWPLETAPIILVHGIWSKWSAHRYCTYFSCTIDINYVTLGIKSIAVRYTTVDCWIPNKNEIRLASEADFDKIDISLWASSVRTIIFLKILSVDFFGGESGLHKLRKLELFSKKIDIFCFGANLMGPYFSAWNIHIRRTPTLQSNSWIPNRKKIRPIVQGLERLKPIHAYIRVHTGICIYRQTTHKNEFLVIR